MVTAEGEGAAIRGPTPFMLRLRGAGEYEDEQNKLWMKIDVAETKVKVERDMLDKEIRIDAQRLTSQKVNEGEQIGNIMVGKKLETEHGLVKPQQIPFFTSDRFFVTDISGGKAENVDLFDSGWIYQLSSLTQDSTLSKFIDLKSEDDPVQLRKAALRNMTTAGFPLHHCSNLVLADERLRSTSLPPPPELPFYSELKLISPTRRALMRGLMEETRRTLDYNPYALVDLGKEPNLGINMIIGQKVFFCKKVNPYGVGCT